MNYKQKLIQRHKNPIGLALRVVSYCMIGAGLWSNQWTVIFVFLLIDILNWFFMPMLRPESEITIVNTIVKQEIAWLKSPLSALKLISIITGFILVLLLIVGLWNHNWLILLSAFICLTVLKQLLLKSAAPYPDNQTQKISGNNQPIQK